MRCLGRLPPLAGEFDVDVLIIDDISNHRTFEVSLRAEVGASTRVTGLDSPSNQGCGCNEHS